MVDFCRQADTDGSPVIERVLEIVDDMNRSAKLAMVGRNEHLRYIVATENMKVGDLITTFGDIPRTPVKPQEGDAHPLGALPLGTMICCLQMYPERDAPSKTAAAAGVGAFLVKKQDGRCIVKLPSKREINVDERCMCTVGRVSNVDHDKFQYGKAGARRWAGFRPRSGWWQRKDARFGRKPKRTRPVTVYTEQVLDTTETMTINAPFGMFPLGREKENEVFLFTYPETVPNLNPLERKNPNLLKPKRKYISA